MLTRRSGEDILRGEMVVLRPRLIADAVNEYRWGTDPDLMELDAAEPIRIPFAEFLVYFTEEIKHPSKQSRRFAIDTTDGTHIGSCSCYDLDYVQQEGEIGIMIGDRSYLGRGYGADAVRTLVNYIFQGMALERIRLRTLSSNVRAQRCFERVGFVACGCVTRKNYEFIVMELYRRRLPPEM